MTPNKYRSAFTGPEIDEILASVKDKMNESVIKNDYSGGADFVASAELVKQLKAQIDALTARVAALESK